MMSEQETAVPPKGKSTPAHKCRCGTMVSSDKQTCPKCGAFVGEPDEQPKHQTPAQRAATVGCDRERLPTGIKSLDDATRGGLLTGKRVTLVGPPGSLKTGFTCHLAIRYALAGYAVAVFAADEDGESFLIRWGQVFGIDRDELERGEESARLELAQRLSELPNLDLWDADVDEGATIGTVSESLVARRGDKPSVLLCDSIQTIARALPGDLDIRTKVDAVVAQTKSAARNDGHLVISTSEAGRGFYASRQKANRADPLAAAKESGGIEYGGDLQLVFSSVKDESGVSDVEVPKNRLGPRKDFVFRLRMSFRTTEFTELPIDADDDEDEALRARMGKAEQRVMEYVWAHQGASGREITRKAGGTAADNEAALDVLERGRRVERRRKVGKGGGFAFWPVAASEPSRDSSEDSDHG